MHVKAMTYTWVQAVVLLKHKHSHGRCMSLQAVVCNVSKQFQLCKATNKYVTGLPE